MNTRIPLALLLTLPAAQSALAQSCTGVTDFSGHYMFVATRQLLSTPVPPPDRVNNVEQQYSATPTGSLLRRLVSLRLPWSAASLLTGKVACTPRPPKPYTLQAGSELTR